MILLNSRWKDQPWLKSLPSFCISETLAEEAKIGDCKIGIYTITENFENCNYLFAKFDQLKSAVKTLRLKGIWNKVLPLESFQQFGEAIISLSHTFDLSLIQRMKESQESNAQASLGARAYHALQNIVGENRAKQLSARYNNFAELADVGVFD
ncbi:unnamed protein product [Blepharisma stoltei]|uniref:Uncharacterized protein n=1 Tax=Blepharisma stoltei TaxID=1481888 RepID=A0AAU9J8J0_9CILI|nr:unnamed protein product [Blepharisma stoltei]